MSTAEGVLAFVPMRHRSERVPGKNYRQFAGRPLYAWILESLEACRSIDRIVVDTDSERIREGVRESFPDIEVRTRPEELRDGEVPMNEVLLAAVREYPARVYLQTHSTNPLLRTSTLEAAIQTFQEGCPTYDSLFSVTALHTRLWDPLARPINHNPALLLRTQDLPPVYEENSCLYLFTGEGLERHRNRIGSRPRLFPIPAVEAWDIDEEIDFRVGEHLARERDGIDAT